MLLAILGTLTAAANPWAVPAAHDAYVADFGFTQTVAACDRAFIGSRDTDACIRTGVHPAKIEACDRAFIGSRDTLTCLATAATPDVVGRCDHLIEVLFSSLDGVELMQTPAQRDCFFRQQ